MQHCRGWEDAIALCLIAAALPWYGSLQVRWFAIHLKQSHGRSFVDAALGMTLSLAVVVGAGTLFR